MSLKDEVDEILEKGLVNHHEVEAVAEYIEHLEYMNAELAARNSDLVNENHGLQEDLQLSDEALKDCTQRCNSE